MATPAFDFPHDDLVVEPASNGRSVHHPVGVVATPSGRLRTVAVQALETLSFRVLVAPGAESTLTHPAAAHADLFIVDGRTGEGEALAACRGIRDRGDAIILLVVRQLDDRSIVEGHSAGADQVLGPAPSAREVVARIAAVKRRPASRPGEDTGRLLRIGPFLLRRDARVLERGGQEVDLTPTEYRILDTLAESPWRAVRRDDLVRRVWGRRRIPTTHTVNTHVSSLRRKVEEDPLRPQHVLTVRNVGYRLEP